MNYKVVSTNGGAVLGKFPNRSFARLFRDKLNSDCRIEEVD